MVSLRETEDRSNKSKSKNVRFFLRCTAGFTSYRSDYESCKLANYLYGNIYSSRSCADMNYCFDLCNSRLKQPVSLPPSLSDATPISFPHTSDSKEDRQELNEEFDEEGDADEEEEDSDYDSDSLPGIMWGGGCGFKSRWDLLLNLFLSRPEFNSLATVEN